MTISDWLIISATLMGPVLAVQAQKWIERTRDVTGRREWLFATLMATRNARLDTDHIRALNMIDVAYAGSRLGGRSFRNQRCQDVLNKWRSYLDTLSVNVGQLDERQVGVYLHDSEERFVDLLAALAAERGFEFDRVTLKKGGYHPIAMGTAYDESNALRTAALAVLSGKQSVRIQVNEQEHA